MARRRDELHAQRAPEVQRRFGRHLRSLREARGWSREKLADRSQLAHDTVGRLELGSFSPSLRTVFKLADGLGVSLTTIFSAFEAGGRQHHAELRDLVGTLSPAEVEAAMRVLRLLVRIVDVADEG